MMDIVGQNVRTGQGTALIGNGCQSHPGLIAAGAVHRVTDHQAELTMTSLASRCAASPVGFSQHFFRHVAGRQDIDRRMSHNGFTSPLPLGHPMKYIRHGPRGSDYGQAKGGTP